MVCNHMHSSKCKKLSGKDEKMFHCASQFTKILQENGPRNVDSGKKMAREKWTVALEKCTVKHIVP